MKRWLSLAGSEKTKPARLFHTQAVWKKLIPSSCTTRRRGFFRSLLAVLAGCAGCGLRAVELAPNAQDEIVIGDVPRSAIDQLRGAGAVRSDPARLAFVYPASGAVLPANFAPITFQWSAMAAPKPGKPAPKDMMSMGRDAGMMMPPPEATMPMPMMSMPMPAAAQAPPVAAFELRVQGPRTALKVYTAANAAALPASRWSALVRESTGSSLKLELRALFSDTREIIAAPALQLPVRGATPAGALYFWSTTAQGVLRGRLDESRAAFLAPPAQANETAPPCGGCHAVARDGRRLLLGRGSPGELAAYSLPELESLLPAPGAMALAYGWGAFDPTASRIAVTSQGMLRVLDADTGAPLAQAVLDPSARVSHPDWSPDGRFIAFSLWPGDATGNDDENLSGSSIARVRVALDGSLGAPESLAEPAKDESLVFPVYSPDGTWLAFERAKGRSKEAKDAALMLMPAGGGAAIELKHAEAAGMDKGVDSMPTFMPGERAGDYFVLFSSTRSYGSHALEPAQEQLYATAIDGAAAEHGDDPSHPALWLPFQELGSSQHRALFAPEAPGCAPAPELCDGKDDDCDGRIDEDCCKPAAETCGNARDDDCDGRTDEGCGCDFEELCGDGKDNDCDGRIDEDCAK